MTWCRPAPGSKPGVSMQRGRAGATLWGLCVLALAGWACESARNPGGFTPDLIKPTITLTASSGKGTTAATADTQQIGSGLSFSAGATDNLALNDIRLTYSGGFIDTTDTIFANQTLKSATLPVSLSPGVLGSGAGGLIQIIGHATDGAGNFAEDTLFIFLFNLNALNVVLVSTGTFTVQGFAVDSANRRGSSAIVVVTIQSVLNDLTPPRVEQTVALRAEVGDTILVHATDPSGITRIGFTVADTTGAIIGGDSLNFAGTSTDITKKFSLKLAGVTTFPTRVVVQAFAIDGAAALNRGVTGATFTVPSPTGPARADTVTLVAGVTRALPLGSHIADAIFNANANGGTGELYLTNTPLGRVEIFQVANTAFVAGGIGTAGPQPWGIALWPHDTLGGYGDTIVVADAGGTEMSVMDVVARRLRWRQDLPNYQVIKYNVVNVGGFYESRETIYDLSDRPQYIATVCRGNCDQLDSVFVLYSTTPTASSSSPFSSKATLRMEKLRNDPTFDPTVLYGHFFWEIGNVNGSDVSDTLKIVLRRGRPYNSTEVILSPCLGVTINFETFGLGDSTFARNSGNFTHGFFGEGGNASATYRRVMSYTTRGTLRHGAADTFLSCQTSPPTSNFVGDAGNNDEDLGMSPAVDVSDFISNTGVKVASIGTNFNGGTNLVRADSIYVLDEGLRLKGTFAAPVGAFGMDMNYFHDFQAGQGGSTGLGGTRDSTLRVAFAADPAGNVLVFDTFFYNVIGSIPVRDPIVGPLRVAKDASGNQLLFGVTARGLVMVKLPLFPNPNPAPRR